MTFIIDASQVQKVAVELSAASAAALPKAAAVAGRGAMNVKKTAQSLAPKGPHTPHYARSISYDVTTTATGVQAEIGPDKNRRQGPLGNIFEYGTGDTPPRPHLGPALEAEADNFEKFIGEITDDVL